VGTASVLNSRISGGPIADAGWEAVVKKPIAVAFLIAVLLEPTIGGACTTNNSRPTNAKNEKPTPLAGSYLTCKKSFPHIGAVVSVPCPKRYEIG
jgi:hypothetical protein